MKILKESQRNVLRNWSAQLLSVFIDDGSGHFRTQLRPHALRAKTRFPLKILRGKTISRIFWRSEKQTFEGKTKETKEVGGIEMFCQYTRQKNYIS